MRERPTDRMEKTLRGARARAVRRRHTTPLAFAARRDCASRGRESTSARARERHAERKRGRNRAVLATRRPDARRLPTRPSSLPAIDRAQGWAYEKCFWSVLAEVTATDITVVNTPEPETAIGEPPPPRRIERRRLLSLVVVVRRAAARS